MTPQDGMEDQKADTYRGDIEDGAVVVYLRNVVDGSVEIDLV